MTREYTPTDNGIAHYAARGMGYMGICEYDEAKRRWSRWLVAHDAEVRDKALTPIRDIVKDEPSPCAWHDKPDDIVTCGWKHDIIAIRNILKEES